MKYAILTGYQIEMIENHTQSYQHLLIPWKDKAEYVPEALFVDQDCPAY